MKLLVVSHSCATAANQRLYEEIEAATGWDITIVIPARWKDEFGNVLDERPLAGARTAVRKIPVLGNGNIILHVYRRAWSGWLRQEKFDAIYMNHEPYALATAQVCLASRRLPAAFGFYSCQNIVKQYPFPFRLFERQVYRRSRFAFPITEAVAEVLRAKGYRGAMNICPLPVDPAIHFPRGGEADHARIPRTPNEMVIGFAGRLVEAKGLRTLARALGRLRDLSWKIVLAGEGDFEKEFRSLLDTENIDVRAQFLGYVPHEKMPDYLSAFDILVLPSETRSGWKEQFGRVIPEALACGTPVIGSDSGEIPTLIRSSGGGLVFPEKDDAALAEGLRRLMEDGSLRRDLADRGRAWVAHEISQEAVARRMATAIRRAVENSHATQNA